MKHLYICLAAIICFSAMSCSKSGTPAPAPHTIKITATGTASFTAVVSAIKTTSAASQTLEAKTVTTGTNYSYTTTLNTGDALHFEIQTMSENTVNYSITDNGTIAAQQSGKELISFSKTTADYTVN